MNQNGPEQHGAKTNEEINYLMHADNIYGVYFSKGRANILDLTYCVLTVVCG